MGIEFAELPEGPGGFFKPAEHADAVAILVEVKDFIHQKPTSFGPRDTVVADWTVFASVAELEAGKPSSFMPRAEGSGNFIKDLDRLVGKATIGKLGTVPTKNAKDAWVLNRVSPEVQAAVVKYAEDREARVAADLASAPTF